MLLHADVPLAPHDVATAWALEPALTVPLALTAALYARGTAALWRRAGAGRGVRRGEAAAFAAGWVALAVAMVSPLHAMGRVLFAAHMTQHELLMALAAPLLVLGRPLLAALWALPPRWRRALGAAARHPALARAWGSVATPLAATLVHLAALLAWHAPPLYQATLRSEAVHAVQHLSFLGSALLFWWAVLGARPRARAAAVAALFGAMLVGGALGALLTFATRLWYPAYAATTGPWGLSPLEDQQIGGILMWIPGGLGYLVAALALLARVLHEPAPRSARGGPRDRPARPVALAPRG